MNLWNVIQGLNGTQGANSPNEAISHSSCTITNIKTKVNVLVNHYDRVNKLSISKADTDLKCLFKKQLDSPSADNESCSPV